MLGKSFICTLISLLRRLSDLQEYLSDPKWGAEHYSHGGREPLLYVTVLLLSLQFHRAVAFLAKHRLTDAFRVDAPHFAIALLAHEVSPPDA